jgi:DNA-directed RNA polymerase subunit RPC12/RpoP
LNPRQSDSTYCRECGAEFVSEELLREHVQEFHRTQAVPRCSVCGSSFAHSAELDAHLRTEHGVDVAETVPCLECGLEFAGPAELEEHVDREHPQRAGMGGRPSRS